MSDLERLSPEQRQVVETWGRGLAVMAGAGSGKTTTLVVKCVELLRSRPEARLCAVSFTERSAGDLREKLSAQVPLPGHWVMTIHGLCGSIIRDFPREAGFHGDERMLSEPEAEALWESAIDSLWFEAVPDDVQVATTLLLARESRTSLLELLRRVKALALQGALESLAHSKDDAASFALYRVGAYVLERYERLKQRRGALDFNDLERGADRALEFSEVRSYYQRRFDLVMVDEFQDTNPLQARIVFRFARPDMSNLCVVGDPKQSIYRFRDADVSVFEECCERLPERLSLTWNFRSRPGIIDFSNRVCAPAFEASQMRYDALVPRREADPSLNPVEVLEDASPGYLARWILSEQSRGVRLGEMALLLRKIRGKEEWLRALTAAGIPVAVGSGGLFWSDPRVRELTAFLKWWSDPSHLLSGAVFLRAPWVAIDDLRLDEWIRREPGRLRELFLSSCHPIAEHLNRVTQSGSLALRPGQLLIELLLDDQRERELGAPLLGLWHRAEELSSRGMDFHRVVHELATAMEEGRRERDVPPPRSEEGGGQLLVLTVHASKGLEFPHVILLDFPESGERPRASPLLFWDRRKGAWLARRDEEGERDKKIEAPWREEERRQELAESKRVFYVALTRARERLVLAYPESRKSERPKFLGSPGDSVGSSVAEKASHSAKASKDDASEKGFLSRDHWRGWIDASAPGLPRVRDLMDSAAAREKPELPSQESHNQSFKRLGGVVLPQDLMRARHSVTEWNLLSRCPRAYEWTYLRPSPEGGGHWESPRELDENGRLSQRELGTRVHECLERLDEEGLRRLEIEVGPERFQAEPVIQWARQASHILSREIDGQALGEKGTSEGRVSLSKPRIWSEASFEVPVGGEVLVGSIDRLVRTGDDFEVIDFKVTREIKGEEALLEAYRNQLLLYAWALGRIEIGSRNRTLGRLVNISAANVESVVVPLPSFDSLEALAAQLASEAAHWIRSAGAPPKPGKLCRVCDFRKVCPEGRASFGNL